MEKIKINKLQNICKIQLGFQFRKRIEHEPKGMYSVIQMKDIDNYTLNITELIKVNIDNIKNDYIVDKGAILFMPRGFNNEAVLITENLVNTIATAQFYILKVETNDILLEYLVWYINQQPAQKYFASIRAGSALPIINISQLKELEIKIPDLETQKNIIRIFDLARKEKELQSLIQNKKSLLIENVLMNKINV
jgi:restriction endonuclease S subunit